MKTYKSVDEYMKDFSGEAGKKLQEMRRIIKKNAKGAEEYIGYGMPGYKLNGRLLYFAAFKDHVSLFGFPETNRKFAKELKKFATSKGTIQFEYGKPLPTALISKIVKYRVKENLGKK